MKISILMMEFYIEKMVEKLKHNFKQNPLTPVSSKSQLSKRSVETPLAQDSYIKSPK